MASFTTFFDDFSAPTLNVRWATNGDGTLIVANQAVLNSTSKGLGFSGLSSAAGYDLSNTGAWIQVVGIPASAFFTSFGVGSIAISGGYNELNWVYDYTAGAWQVSSPINTHGYAPAGAAIWLRIANTGGTGGSITWDYSVNGINWTTVWTETMSDLQTENFGTAIPLTSLYLNAYIDTSGVAGQMTIDNANVIGASGASGGGFIMFA